MHLSSVFCRNQEGLDIWVVRLRQNFKLQKGVKNSPLNAVTKGPELFRGCYLCFQRCLKDDGAVDRSGPAAQPGDVLF